MPSTHILHKGDTDDTDIKRKVVVDNFHDKIDDLYV